MWLIFAVLSLFCFAFSDLLGKKHIDGSHALAPIKLIASVNALAVAVGFILSAFSYVKCGALPWLIICKEPLILLSVFCFTLHWVLFLFSMRYVGLSIEEAVQSTFGVFYFVGLVLVKIFTKKLSSVGEMLHPLRLVPIILVLVFTILLPNTEVFAQRKNKDSLANKKLERRNIIIGILLLIISTIFDTLDSLIATVILSGGEITAFDYMQASYLAQILPFVVFSVYIAIKQKKAFVPFAKGGKGTLIYGFSALFSSVLYLISCSYDAVRTGVLFIAYPIVPIIGAKLFLKEKYTARQNLCIWIITLSAMLFCVADAFLGG